MDLIEAIGSRRSIRGFKPDPVPKKVLEQLIEISRWSPSGSNSQPWEFTVLGGKALELVKDRLLKDMKISKAHPDIPYPPMPEPYRSRQRDLLQAQTAYRQPGETPDSSAGGRFFDAPTAIIVSVDKEISPRAFMGLGMVAQTIALAALNFGLGTCIMSMVTYWPEVYRESFAIPDSKIIAFGIAIGYPDMAAAINNFPRTREPLDSFVRWHGFPK
jgi:nitroreductase